MQSQSNDQASQYQTTPSRTAAAMEDSREMVSEHPFSSVMLAFGVGFGVGLVLGSALVESTQRDRALSEKIGHQMIDAMSRVLPDSLSARLHK